MQLNLIPSLLFCHSIFSTFGIDEMTDLIVVSDPQQTGEFADISTLGVSVKESVKLIENCQFMIYYKI